MGLELQFWGLTLQYYQNWQEVYLTICNKHYLNAGGLKAFRQKPIKKQAIKSLKGSLGSHSQVY